MPIISKKVGDRDSVTIGNGIWGIKWSHDRFPHVTQRDQGRDPDMKNAYYLENG